MISTIEQRLCQNQFYIFRGALSCKQEAELQLMFQYKARWSCHFDDDTFVNYGQLRKTLESYDETKEIYLGRRSVAKPISISYNYEDNHKQSSFVFGTGGAGWCISRPLLIKIEKVLSETTFSDISNQIRLPDDVTVGFVVNELLKIELTNDDHFNSHLTNLASLDPTQQVRRWESLRYKNTKTNSSILCANANVVNLIL